jgi:hypothetical protein
MINDTSPTTGADDEPYDPNSIEEEDYGPSMPISRWLVPLGIVVVIAALVGIALVRGQTMLDPSTPEGAVQQYLLAVTQERWDDALEFLDPETFGNCTAEDFRMSITDRITSVSHEGTFMGPVEAQVQVLIRYSSGGGIGGSWESSWTYSLVERDRNWYITREAWPAELWTCAGFR